MFRLFLLSLLISGCAERPSEFRKFASVDALVSSGGFSKKLVKGENFWITTFGKTTDINQPYVFYIEGDGLVSRDDLTPRNFMLLNLAMLDKRPNVYYISRLCQYTPMHMNPKCHKKYWAEYRYSEEAVNELNSVINRLNNSKPFDLVGFSGGGAMAVLVGARNNKVGSILTIAANLDLETFVKFHNMHMSHLSGSLNPMHYVSNVQRIPQLHIFGSKDKIVPSIIGSNFAKKAASKCVQIRIMPGVEHNYYWLKHWDEILSYRISCDDYLN